MRARSRGIILIVAPAGGGKTTALRHLKALLPEGTQVAFFESGFVETAREAAAERLVVLAAFDSEPADACVEVIELCPWTLDDCMEYLAAMHRAQCESVLARLGRDPSLGVLEGSPQLLSLVMDAMARDLELGSARDVLRDHIQRIFPAGPSRDRLVLQGPFQAPLGKEQWRWWRHVAVQYICTADWIAERLCEGRIPEPLHSMAASTHLIPEIAAAVKHRPDAIECLERLIRKSAPSRAVAMAASILIAVDANWRPADGRGLDLSHALLPGARWSGLDLSGAILEDATLVRADLSSAKLVGAKAVHVDLREANLHGAMLKNSDFTDANLGSADLSEVTAMKADFSDASLESANMSRGVFRSCRFIHANLKNVQAGSASFLGARLFMAGIEQADFTHANLARANLRQIDLSQAKWAGASFATARLIACNLEGLELPGADFAKANLTGSLLTGSRIPGGNFCQANLTRAGVAEIDWENADLSGADFTEASFHMGSTRSGLVGSTIPCEGSRTGFYTDEFNEQLYKSPEEIRKACLCGANLLGAKVEGTDFYLVDLRRAVFSAQQRRHFLRSGAILRSAQV